MKNLFNAYAHYYDLLYGDKAYDLESMYLHSLIECHSSNNLSILELGSGTGGHAEHLAAMGYNVHGVDLSSTMVEFANLRKKGLAPAISDRLSFETNDIREYRTQRKFDVVISLFHVMSYQTSNADLLKVFETAAHHLNPGGLFIFDYWYGPAVLTQRPLVKVKRMENDRSEVLRIAEPMVDVSTNSVKVDFTVLVSNKRKKSQISLVQENHTMRYLFLPELELLSKEFRLMNSYAWMSKISPTSDDWSAVSIMRLL